MNIFIMASVGWIFSKANKIFVIFVIALSILISSVTLASGQNSGWSQPVRLSSTERSGWFPDVVTDVEGRIHVVWSAVVTGTNAQQYDAILYRTSVDGQNWTETNDIFVPEMGYGEATRPNLYVDEKNTLHITFRGRNVYYSRAVVDPRSTKSWLSSRKINQGGQVAYFSDLIADKAGTLHLIYTENVETPECPICYHLYYRKSTDTGLSWSHPVDISKILLGVAKPQLILDNDHNLHVVWEAGIGGSYGQLVPNTTTVMYSASFDGGETWARPTEFIAPGGRARNITIGADGNNRLIIVWLGLPENLIYFQYSDDQGKSWSAPHSLPGIVAIGTHLDDFTMVTDSAGNVHLAIVGSVENMPEANSIIHFTWDDTAWSSPDIITSFYGDLPEWPRLAIGLGNQLHATWFVRDEAHIWDSNNQEYQIWYSQKSLDAPRLVPSEWQIARPTPSPLPPTATPTPTITPVPTVAPEIANIPVPDNAVTSIYTENDEILLLLQSLIPAALILILVLGGIQLWRR